MAYYLIQAAYTPEAWAKMVKSPQDRKAAIAPMIEKLGGRLESFWISFGDYDAAVILQAPDNVTAAALSLAASAGGSVKAIKTTPLMTMEEGMEIAKNQVEVGGRKYSVYVGDRVSMAHQSQVHGPALVGSDSFIGMQALVFKATVGDGVVLEPGAKVIGVKIASGRYVPAGSVITNQADADALPEITDTYAFKDLNKAVVHVNTQFADGYNGKKPAPHKKGDDEGHDKKHGH